MTAAQLSFSPDTNTWIPEGGATAVSAYQWRMALAQQGKLDDAYAGVGDLDTPPRIQWDSCHFIVPGDALAANVQATLGYTSGDMTTLFILARTF